MRLNLDVAVVAPGTPAHLRDVALGEPTFCDGRCVR